MYRIPLSCLIAAAFFFATDVLSPIDALAQDKPLLSEAVKKVIDSDGVDAANKRFSEWYPAQKSNFKIDMEGLTDLAAEYMQNGDLAAGSAIAYMVGMISQDVITDMMEAQPQVNPGGNDEAAEQLAAQFEAAQKEIEEMERTKGQSDANDDPAEVDHSGTSDLGESRDDLGRFAGLYGDPEETDPNRKLIVSKTCDGYIISMAMWGDASPWVMKSTGDTSFSFKSSFQSYEYTFETDGTGSSERLIHTMDFISSPLERLESVPDNMAGCYERRTGR